MIKPLFFCMFMSFSTVIMAMDLELTQGINAVFPVGIDRFEGSSQASLVEDVIEHDLRMMGQFKIIKPEQGQVGSASLTPWKRLGADSVLSAKMTCLDANRCTIHVQLTDVASRNRSVLVKDYQASVRELRQLAHHISDEVYHQLTGERGVFSTRIAYVLVERWGERARYSLEVAEPDGSNPARVVVSNEPIMSPSWSPDGRQIAYVSFEKKQAQIYSVMVETGQRRLLTSFPGINGAPAWSPDGRSMVVVLSKTGSPKLYTVDLATGSMKQLTYGDAIDTEPRFSPDGQSLLFTSGRGGSPQVYSMNLTTSIINRLTYDGNYNAKASFTPDQKTMVMLHREDRERGFNIGVMRMGQSAITPLTDSPMDESPTMSPNGRLVLYATRYQDRGVLALVSLDGRVRMRFPPRAGDMQDPAWSSFL